MALAVLSFARSGRAESCKASTYKPVGTTRDAILSEAGQLAVTGQHEDARAAYQWLLARHPDDGEALFGLARVDSWDGCWERADSEYGRVLGAHPEDADVRSGFVDLLMWQGRFDEAARMIDAGLDRDPLSPALLARKARLEFWQGDATKATQHADLAEQLAPGDADLREMRLHMFLGEARASARLDRYPAGYQDLYTLSTQVLQRYRRFEVYGGLSVFERPAITGAPAITDLRYAAGVNYHPAFGATVGAELAIGAPATAIPDVATKVWALAPLTTRVSAYLSYQFWHFDGGEMAHILNPSIGVNLPYELRVDLRAFVSSISLPSGGGHIGQTELAGAAGAQLGWSASAKLDVAVSYTYGAELDQNPALFQLMTFHSHVVSGYADYLFDRHHGVRPLLAVERREAPSGDAIWIASAELGAYVRW